MVCYCYFINVCLSTSFVDQIKIKKSKCRLSEVVCHIHSTLIHGAFPRGREEMKNEETQQIVVIARNFSAH